MKILLTGASSYVGARLYFDLKNAYSLIGTYFHNQLSPRFIKLDVTDKNRVEKTIKEIKPEIIIHVANYPSVRNSVNNEENFTALNKKTTEYIVENANKIGAKMIFISSLAATNPNDVYGKFKMESEESVKTVKAGYLILRPSLIIGLSPNTQNDRPFNRMLKCLDDKTKQGAFDTSWKLQPTYVGHLSQIIDKAIKRNYWNRTVSVYIDEMTTQYQIAKDILKRFDISVLPEDKHINIPQATEDLAEMRSFNVVPATYKELIETITGEIKNRNQFVL